MDDNYDYSSSGLDKFFSRSIDNLNQVNLDSQGPISNSMPFDRGQTSGQVGDIFKVGNIIFDGKNSTVTINDGNSNAAVVINGKDKRIEIRDTSNLRVMAGQLPDTNYGWAVSKPGSDVQNGFTG